MDPQFTPDHPLPSFAQQLATLDNVLPPDDFARLVGEVEKLVETERSYLPAHKKGGTVAYETSCSARPFSSISTARKGCGASSRASCNCPSSRRRCTTRSSCSVLFYEKPGDHIGWHYDHNFYKGRHFTVLIPIDQSRAASRTDFRRHD